jgi:hypothetical protein
MDAYSNTHLLGQLPPKIVKISLAKKQKGIFSKVLPFANSDNAPIYRGTITPD